MIKLTQQEIEQERVKFEEYAKKIGIPLTNWEGVYKSDYTFTAWKAWLARAELAKGE